MTLPTLPLPKLFNLFPLYSYPLPPAKSSHDKPTLWIVPPGRSLDANANSGLLSANVECLKWQAYIALRGVKNIAVRWDMAPEGALDGRLPNLHVPAGADTESQLLKAQDIPAWVDSRVGSGVDTLQGFKDERMRDESHAWVSLLEGVVHAALVCLAVPFSSVHIDMTWPRHYSNPLLHFFVHSLNPTGAEDLQYKRF